MLSVTLLVLLALNYSNGIDFEFKKKMTMIAKQVECAYTPVLVSNFTCTYKKLSWKNASYTFDGYLRPGVVVKNLYLTGNLYKKGTNLEYRQFGPKDVTFDICGLMNGSWTIIYMEQELIMKGIKEKGNIFHHCPYKGHIYVKDFVFRDQTYKIIEITPSEEYYFQTILFTKTGKEIIQELVTTKMYAEVKYKGAYEF